MEVALYNHSGDPETLCQVDTYVFIYVYKYVCKCVCIVEIQRLFAR
jgi:hypothetical protein